MRRNAKEAIKHLKMAKELAKRLHSPLAGLTIEEAIKKMRKVREELWEEKLATRS